MFIPIFSVNQWYLGELRSSGWLMMWAEKNAGMMVVLSLVYSWTVIYSIGKTIQICISLHYAHKTRKVWVVVFYNFKKCDKVRTCGSWSSIEPGIFGKKCLPCPSAGIVGLGLPAFAGKNLKTCASETTQGFPSDHQILFPGDRMW